MVFAASTMSNQGTDVAKKPRTRKRELYWFKFDFKDYLAKTSHLSLDAHGAYLLLRCHYWLSEGNLPTDDKALAKLLHLPMPRYRAVMKEIRGFFDAQWRHFPSDEEMDRAREIGEKRRAAVLQRYNSHTIVDTVTVTDTVTDTATVKETEVRLLTSEESKGRALSNVERRQMIDDDIGFDEPASSARERA